MPLIESAIPLRSTTWTLTVIVLAMAWVSKFTLVWLSEATGSADAAGVTEVDGADGVNRRDGEGVRGPVGQPDDGRAGARALYGRHDAARRGSDVVRGDLRAAVERRCGPRD